MPPASDTSVTVAAGLRSAWRTGAVTAAAATAITVSVIVLLLGGGIVTDSLPGLAARDPLVTWLVPILKLSHDLLAVMTVGLAVAAAFFVDSDNGRIGPQQYRWLRTAGWSAVAWVAVSIAQAFANYGDYLAQPLSTITPKGMWSYLWTTESGYAYLLTAVLTLIVAIIALNTLSVTGAGFVAVLSLSACLPVVFTGHAIASGNHQIAVDSMIFHVIGAVLWFGGLVALLVSRRVTDAAVSRYSALALVAFIAVALSGVINAATRIYSWNDLFGTAYGIETLGKVAALIVLGGFGLWHRKVTLPKLKTRPALFRRFAVVEILVLGATFGLAPALSRTPPPPVPDVPDSAMQAWLGFPMPERMTPHGVVLEWYPELVLATLGLTAIGAYIYGVVRLHRRHDTWPIMRTVTWTAGWLLAIFVTSSGLAKYSMVIFSAHMVQHMTLNMLVPILLVLGAPVTLALRVLPGRKTGRGPRDWLLLILHSRVMSVLSHPLVALVIYAFSLYMMYFTGLYEWAMRSHAGHLFMLFHFLAAGGMFYWVIIGIDPTPRRLPYPAKILLFFVAIVFHTIFGLVLMMSTELLAPDWFLGLGRADAATLLAEQRAGGGIAWAFGEPPSLIVLVALIWQWSRSEDRAARRIDRQSDRAQAQGRPEDDPHEQYNAYLARLAEADRKAGLRD